ncbi:hypothetical protein N8613_01690 [Verrucomicrobia bacterium]|jgi:hypothetical protein|nr:hypothetical protein [Verrucomicrobiota bacterium]
MDQFQSNLTQLRNAPCLIKPTSECEQWRGIIKFVESIRQLAGPYEIQLKTVCEQSKNIYSRNVSLEYARRLSIALFEYAVLDEIRPDNYNKELIKRNYSWADNASIYHRFYAYNGVIPQSIFEILRASTDSLNSYIIGSIQHIAQNYRGIGLIGRLTSEIGYLLNTNHIPQPPICVHRSTLFTLSLKSGSNPLAGYVTTIRKKLKSEKEPRYMRRNRSLIKLRHLSTKGILGLRDRSISCWENLLYESIENETKRATLLFSSGTSANETVIHFVASKIKKHAYMHPYWYFENENSLKNCLHLQQEKINDQTRVAFINLEPATTHSYQPDEELVSPVSVIKEIFDSARKKPELTFWLIVDVTMDPLFQTTETVGGQLPSNLLLIKTISVTKHQFGCRNYFFGVTTLIGSSELVQDGYKNLLSMRSKFGGCPQEGHYMSFPRQSRQRIQKIQKTIKLHSFNLTEWMPSKLSWKIVNNTYLAFLIPPLQPINEIAELLLQQKRELGTEDFKKKFQFLETIHHQLNNSLIQRDHYRRFPNIELGNSFGLSTTRVLYDQGNTIFNHKRVGMGTIRIAPGFDTNESELKEYFIEMVEQFAICMRSIASQLGCKQHLDLIYPSSKK